MRYEIVTPQYDRVNEDGSRQTVIEDWVFVEADNIQEAKSVGLMKLKDIPNGYYNTVGTLEEDQLLIRSDGNTVQNRPEYLGDANPNATPPAPEENNGL